MQLRLKMKRCVQSPYRPTLKYIKIIPFNKMGHDAEVVQCPFILTLCCGFTETTLWPEEDTIKTTAGLPDKSTIMPTAKLQGNRSHL